MMTVMTANSGSRSESRRGGFLRNLRRFHAWVGLSGAAFGLLFGLTGFLQNHRAVMKIEAGQVEAHKVQLELDQPPATIEDLAGILATRFGVPMSRIRSRVLPPRPARFGGQDVKASAQWLIQVGGHAHFSRAIYLPGNRTVEVERSDANVVETLQRLHKAEAGQTGWILLTDCFAGALVFLALSGTLLWTRLAGPRLLSAFLALGGLATAILVASRAW
ncbi:PepSY-associated TM helix domain-containing protein [Geothrix mesophila]|uniref:PepSY-associated TM helix domain-containing protein n=1 Tax=Geothrix mesophila TaxID=2922723 RepID=UPI001FADFC2C|nr:PepSY-associated TM helix domain-containing protein [Geothrix sp. SG198]